MRFLPLGGLGEVGKNCMAICDGSDAILVDAGVTFDDRDLGVDVIRPDFRAIRELGLRVHGLVITHGHEDHIGSVAYALKEYDFPVWGPRYALSLLERRRSDHPVLASADLRETSPRQPFRVGPFEVEPIAVTHSIVDATALCIRGSGVALHTGDFKFEEDPVCGRPFDRERLREIGKGGVDVLLSDSTNADVLGSTLGERSIASSLAQITEETKGAMFVALFASNVHRLRILLDIAKQSGRKLVIAGRSMMTHVGIAQMAGLLPGSSGLILSPDQATAVPRNRWLVLCTGSQGEPTSALARIADGTHPHVSVKSGDAVVFSARVIPGNERAVSLMVDDLLRQGARVTTPRNDARLHVSGHAQREEQAEMIALTMPKNFVPIHGTLALMQAHAELARAAGVERVAVVENGTSLVLQGERLAPSHRFASGAVAVAYGKDIPDEVLTEREDLASRGFANVTLAFDAGRREPRVSVALVGCAHRDRQHEIERALASSIVRETGDAKDAEGGLAERVRLLTRRFVEREVGARPTVAVRILQA